MTRYERKFYVTIREITVHRIHQNSLECNTVQLIRSSHHRNEYEASLLILTLKRTLSWDKTDETVNDKNRVHRKLPTGWSCYTHNWDGNDTKPANPTHILNKQQWNEVPRKGWKEEKTNHRKTAIQDGYKTKTTMSARNTINTNGMINLGKNRNESCRQNVLASLTVIVDNL